MTDQWIENTQESFLIRSPQDTNGSLRNLCVNFSWYSSPSAISKSNLVRKWLKNIEASAIANFCPGHCLSPIEKGMKLPGLFLTACIVFDYWSNHLLGLNSKGFQCISESRWFTRWQAITIVFFRILVPSANAVSRTAILSIPVTTGGASRSVYLMHAFRIGRLFIRNCVGFQMFVRFYLSSFLKDSFQTGFFARLQVSMVMKCPVVYTPSEKKVINSSTISSQLKFWSTRNKSHMLNSAGLAGSAFILSYLRAACFLTMFLTIDLMVLTSFSNFRCSSNSPRLTKFMPKTQNFLLQDSPDSREIKSERKIGMDLPYIEVERISSWKQTKLMILPAVSLKKLKAFPMTWPSVSCSVLLLLAILTIVKSSSIRVQSNPLEIKRRCFFHCCPSRRTSPEGDSLFTREF